MKKITATVALASLLARVGCAQGTASPSAETSPVSVSSAATSSQSPDVSDASGGQPQAPYAETPAASSAASAESGASPQSGAASAEHVDSFAIGVGDTQLVVTLADTDAARALAEKLQEGPVTVSLHAYGGFEKVGPLGQSLPANDERITTEPGDVILYQGNQITIYYDQNTWDFTRLARIEDVTREELLSVFGEGDVKVILWIEWSE